MYIGGELGWQFLIKELIFSPLVFPSGSMVKNLLGYTGDIRDVGSIPGLGR